MHKKEAHLFKIWKYSSELTCNISQEYWLRQFSSAAQRCFKRFTFKRRQKSTDIS